MNATARWLFLRYSGFLSRNLVELATNSNGIWNYQRKRPEKLKQIYDLLCVISKERRKRVLKPKVNMSIEEMN